MQGKAVVAFLRHFGCPFWYVFLVLECSFSKCLCQIYLFYSLFLIHNRHLHVPSLCSWEFAAALREAKPKFDAAGFKLITIGVGPSSKAEVLAERVHPIRRADLTLKRQRTFPNKKNTVFLTLSH